MIAPIRIVARAIDALGQDVKYAVRALTRSPGVALTVVVTLGLGVGANASIFTALDRVFLQAPPGVHEPATLRRLYARQVRAGAGSAAPKVTPFLTTRDMLDLAAAVRGVARIEGDYLYRGGRTVPDKQRVLLTYVSPGYFDMLGVRMQRGRGFAAEESRLPGPPSPVAIISSAMWRSRFANDPSVIGKTLNIDESQFGGSGRRTTYTIIGVAGPDFEGLELESVDMWVPLSNVADGNITSLRLVMRANANAEPRFVEKRLSAQYLETHLGDRDIADTSGIIAGPLLAARGPVLSGVSVRLIPNMSDRSLSLLARLGLVGLAVLAIAVTNVASLLLLRARRREREMAVRIALGASPTRIVCQLIAEGVVLSLVAGAAALGIAALTGGLLRTQLASEIHWTSNIIDWRVFTAAMAAAILAGSLASLAPAIFALRTNIAGSLKASTWSANRTGASLRSGLLITQAALCMALLAGAGVILQSLRRAGDADRGFESAKTVLVSVPAYHDDAEADLLRITNAIRARPDVEVVGRSLTGLVATGFRSKVGRSISDTIGEGAQGPWIDFVDQDWGRAAGIKLIAGRMLDSSSAFAQVAVINEALAKALYRGKNIAGTCIRMREPEGACREVIGVVRDVRWDLSSATNMRVYIPLIQAWTRPNTSFVPNYLVVRTRTASSARVVEGIRTLVGQQSAYSDDITVQQVMAMLEPQLKPWRLAAALFLVLGALGLVAGAAGVYGLVAYDVTQRTRELGVRIALGASHAHILRLVVGSAVRIAVLGVGAGVLAALAVGRVMKSLLYNTSPYDPVVLIGTALTLGIVTIVASILPAWRATRISPAAALSAD